MTNEAEQKALEEKQKRKEVARTRTFWLLLVLNVLLIVYIAIQIVLLTGAK